MSAPPSTIGRPLPARLLSYMRCRATQKQGEAGMRMAGRMRNPPVLGCALTETALCSPTISVCSGGDAKAP